MDEKECHMKFVIAISFLIITNLLTLTCWWRRSREATKVHPRRRRARGRASLVELGVPKLAGEMVLVTNRLACQPSQNASGLTNHVQKITAHAKLTNILMNTGDPKECNERSQNSQGCSLFAEVDGKRLIGSIQGERSTNYSISNSGKCQAEPKVDSQCGYNNKSFQNDTVDLSVTYEPSTSSAASKTYAELSPSQEWRQPTEGETSHLARRGTGTRHKANPRVHRLLGYESSVCSTDVELTPRPVSKRNCQVLYQSSLDSSDGECDWRAHNDRLVVTEAVPEVDEDFKTASCLRHSNSYDESTMHLHKEGVCQQETVQDTQKLVTGSGRHQLGSPQLSEDFDGSQLSGLGTDSLQRFSASWKRVNILKSQISIESTNSYNSLRSGVLGGVEDNDGGLTDEDENRQRLEKKKKKQLKDSSKKEARGSAVLSLPDDSSLSVDEVRILEKRNNYHNGTKDKISIESSSTVSVASKSLSTVVDIGYLTQDETSNETFSVLSVENQDEDSALTSSSSKMLQPEDVQIHSSESRGQNQPVVISSSQNTATGENKQTCNHDSTPFRRRLVNAVKERTGRKIYRSMETNENQDGDCGYICV